MLFTGKLVMDGEIRVNGQPMGKFISHMSGFVYQQDLFTGTLTVSEHLHFMVSADRRLKMFSFLIKECIQIM